ncbi:MAG: glycosyltransferase 87 family protein [Lachnospiraceae bacterium]|nr:glycosyltransferase 87 family protein [Lachnospiraceae bacterium]
MRDLIKKFTNDKRFWAVLYVLTALLSLISVYEGIHNALLTSQDFQYDATCALIHGYDPYDLSLDFKKEAVPDIAGLNEFYAYFESQGTPQKMEANQFPSLLYILTPYALLPYAPARILWLITNLLCTAVIIGLLKISFMRKVDDRLYPVFMMVMLAGTPWRNQLGVGQHTIFAVAFFLLAVFVAFEGDTTVIEYAGRNTAVDEGAAEKPKNKTLRMILSGLLLSLSYLKYTVTAPMAFYFIYKRKWKEFVISLVPHIILTGVAAKVLNESFINMLIKPFKVASALTGEGSIDIGVLTGGASWTVVITGIIMLFVIAMAILLPEGNDELFISTAVLLSLIMTYHRGYDFFIMIIVFGFFATGYMKVAEIIFLITTVAIFFVNRIFNDNAISLTVSGALYYACVIAFVVIAAERMFRREQRV